MTTKVMRSVDDAQAGFATIAASEVGAQPLDTELTAIAGLTSAADKGIQFTGSGTAAVYDLTTAGKALLDDAAASDQRTTLGLGTLATQSGTFSGTSSGTNTGDQTLPTRASLVLATTDTPQFAGIEVGAASDTTLARSGAGDLSVEGKGIYRADGTDVAVADGGTGASTAAAARGNLGADQLPLVAARQAATATGAGDQNIYTVAIAANTLGTATGLRIVAQLRRSTGAGTWTVKPKFGGTSMAVSGNLAGAGQLVQVYLWADGATNAQRWNGVIASGSTTVSTGNGTAAIDQTASVNLTIDISLNVTTDVITLDWVSIERLAP